ncbi:ribosome maturation factor RimM [Algimonas porphyrae]|uniref:Ribosome maturation factor RimM n=1 Tax=Algimonas porphyrae TaxID=1128113 RepID=A0ABQ5V379_9PROT|nr:ribosome maturation factor RimM [Algimonas porphyrae]GLQ21125.1 hypothetical protein GCM10007854_20800 [Algimonas porphyrae]
MSAKSPQNSLTCVAAIAGAHGVHGNVKIKSFTADPTAFAAYGPLLNDKGEILFTPKSARPVSRFFSLAVKERYTREALEAMKSTKLFVPRDVLPETDEGEFYYSDLVGLRVDTVAGETVGTVQAVHEFGAGDTLEIKLPEGPSFYHPFTLEAVPQVDLDNEVILVVIEDAIEARGDGAPKVDPALESDMANED